MMGTCKGCGTENVELNEMGMCANCAATPAAPSEPMPGASTDAPAEPMKEEGTM